MPALAFALTHGLACCWLGLDRNAGLPTDFIIAEEIIVMLCIGYLCVCFRFNTRFR